MVSSSVLKVLPGHNIVGVKVSKPAEYKELLDALSVLEKEQRQSFFEWSRTALADGALARHALFGHPYYFITLGKSEPDFQTMSELLAPAHQASIARYLDRSKRVAPQPPRAFIDPLIFIAAGAVSGQGDKIVLVFPAQLLAVICAGRLVAEHITERELRILAQLLGGLTLKDAAAQDAVGYETKRAHVKSVMSKLGISRQSDLVSELSNAILMAIVAQQLDRDHEPTIAGYARKYLPASTRLHHFPCKEGSVHIVELGPQGGDSLVLSHGMYSGDIDDQFYESLRAHNLRLLIPLRAGFIDSTARPRTGAEHLSHAMKGFELAQEIAQDDAIALHSVSLGSYYAHEFIARYPKRIKHLSYLSADPPKNTRVARFYGALSRLAATNPRLLHMALGFYAKKAASPEEVKAMMQKAFLDAPQDMAMIDLSFGAPHYGQQVADWIKSSWTSIAQDYGARLLVDWNKLQRFEEPITFFHGTEDRVAPIALLRDFAAEHLHANVVEIAGMGHLSSARNRAFILKHMRALLDQNSRS